MLGFYATIVLRFYKVRVRVRSMTIAMCELCLALMIMRLTQLLNLLHSTQCKFSIAKELLLRQFLALESKLDHSFLFFPLATLGKRLTDMPYSTCVIDKLNVTLLYYSCICGKVHLHHLISILECSSFFDRLKK